MPNVDVVRLKLLCKDAVGRVKLTLTRGVADGTTSSCSFVAG
jgi:hypothetical protein